jgi:predicted Zn finger-like uncharacterized protein
MLNSLSGINGFGQWRGGHPNRFPFLPTSMVLPMPTLIICPACGTRYETTAVFPPEGRKVRCSKCTHVWQAHPVSRPAAEAAPQQAPMPQAAAPTQRPPQQPMPQPMQPPQSMPQPHSAPRPQPNGMNAGLGGFGGMGAQQGAAGNGAGATPSDGEFGAPVDYDFNAAFNSDEAASTSFGTPADTSGDLSPGYADTLGTNTPVPSSIDYGAAPKHVALGETRARTRTQPVVAIGWAAIVLSLVLVAALFAIAPSAVVSMLPGATRIYSALGMDVNAYGLAFENVRYEWGTAGNESVLEVQGQVANVSSGSMDVPTLEISLKDEKGGEISAWTTELDAKQLAAGEQAPFAAQIPSPPDTVRSLTVRFDKAAAAN